MILKIWRFEIGRVEYITDNWPPSSFLRSATAVVNAGGGIKEGNGASLINPKWWNVTGKCACMFSNDTA